MRRRLRLGTLLVLAALGVAAFAVSSRSHSSPQIEAGAGTAAEWLGLVGSPRAPITDVQRVLVVLHAPSLASQVAAAGGVASDTDERRFSAAALAAQQQIVSALVAKGVAVRPRLRFTRLLNGFSATVDAHSLSLIERAKSVEGVYPVRAAYPAAVTRSRDLVQRGLGVRPDLSLGGFDGSGVTIALLDTGIDPTTPFLHGHLLEGADMLDPGSSPVPRRSPVAPHGLERHGTEMAGLLVGSGGPGGLTGIAPGASVLPLRVAGWQRDAIGNYAIYARTDQILAGLERAVDPNGDGDAHDAARIALVSLAQPFAAFTDDPLAQAAAGALALDMLVVAPAGNDGPAGPAFGSISGPGGAPAALTVGAADLKPMTATEQLVLRSGLRVLFDRPLPLAGAWGSRRGLTLDVVAPRRVVDSSGFSTVAGRAALLPSASSPSAIAAAAASAGAAAVLLRGSRLPAGALGVGEGIAVPVVPLPDPIARTLRAALARGEHVTAALGPTRLRPAAGGETVAPFSSRGFGFDGELKPDLVAPGVTLATAEPASGAPASPFVTVSGSSAAAAVAAGAAAVLLEARPALDAAALKSVLVGSTRRLRGASIEAQGAGRIDLLTAAGVELATDPAAISFGRAPEKGWRGTKTIVVRNLSTRALAVYTSTEQGAHPELSVEAAPTRILISPGGTETVTVRAVPSGPLEPGALSGTLVLTPVGGGALRVPWAVAIAAPAGHLLADVHLSTKTLSTSASRPAPAVLSLRAGRVDPHADGDAIEPVRLLELVLEDGKGKPLGVLARLRDLLPGRYAFGVTPRDADGFALDPGTYVLQLVAWPTTRGDPSRVSLPFRVASGGG
jgi:subtilase family protein